MVNLQNTFSKNSLTKQGVLAGLAIILYLLASFILEKSYAASLFPVSYFEAQTSFDAQSIKMWYNAMIQKGSLNIYLQTQFIDFGFIAAVCIMGLCLWTFVANLHHSGSRFHTYGKKLAYALPLAGLFDVLENGVSFFMIADPSGFPSYLVYIYSGFATIKFGFWTIALVWLALSIIILGFRKVTSKLKLAFAVLVCLCIVDPAYSQETEISIKSNGLIYFEADPFAYINKGYSLHLGYENWGYRLDLTKVKVDFPEAFEEAFYGSSAFDLVTYINGFKLDYIGKRSNWTKGAFFGLDVNHQKLSFTHRESNVKQDLSAFNIGLRLGYKINLYKGLYVTPWMAVWRNASDVQSFSVGDDIIKTNQVDWITTLHFGYSVPL